MDEVLMYEEILRNENLKKQIFDSIIAIDPTINIESIIAVKWSPVFNKIGAITLVLTNDTFYYIAKLKKEKKLTSHPYLIKGIKDIQINKFGKGSIVNFWYYSQEERLISTDYEQTNVFFEIVNQLIECGLDEKQIIESSDAYDNDINIDTDINLEDMDIEELKKQIEKEKLIAELKMLKQQNSNITDAKESSIHIETIASDISKPLTKKQQIKENKKNGIACCPKCGSTSIQAGNKKLSVGRALVGTMIMPGVGTVLGGLSSKKTVCTCLNCGHKWKL